MNLFQKVKMEYSKVEWPSKTEVIHSTIWVITMTVIVSVYLGVFDILAVNCRPFTDNWDFAFALNVDLERSSYKKYSPLQQSKLIKSMQYLTWPLKADGIFTTDFQDVLDRAWKIK